MGIQFLPIKSGISLHQGALVPRLVLLSLPVLLFAISARADIYDVTFTSVTFSATCVGGIGTCTEVINGSGLYDSVANTASDISILLTGSLNASLDAYATPICTNALLCLTPPVLYDTGALPGYNPIEFSPELPTLDAPTPEALEGGANGTLLFVPGQCGGDQALCGSTGTFPGGADYELVSGTYTSVDQGPSPTPEPRLVFLLTAGAVLLALLSRRKRLVL